MRGAVQSSPLCFEPPTREAALSIVALAASLLFAHGHANGGFLFENAVRGPPTETVFLAKAHRKPSAACLSRRG